MLSHTNNFVLPPGTESANDASSQPVLLRKRGAGGAASILHTREGGVNEEYYPGARGPRRRVGGCWGHNPSGDSRNAQNHDKVLLDAVNGALHPACRRHVRLQYTPRASAGARSWDCRDEVVSERGSHEFLAFA